MAAVAVGLQLQHDGPLAGAAVGHRLVARRLDRQHVHAVHLHAGDAEALAAAKELGLRRGPLDRGAHGVLVVFDDVDHRQLPQRGHVEGLVDLALVGGAVAEIGQRDVAALAVFEREADAGAERNLGGDDAVAAVEVPLRREHVHRAALAPRVAPRAPGELGHDAARVHAADQHVGVIAVAGDDRVVRRDGRLHAPHHRLLTDVEMAEAAEKTHAVELPHLLLEAPQQQHLAVEAEHLLGACVVAPGRRELALASLGRHCSPISVQDPERRPAGASPRPAKGAIIAPRGRPDDTLFVVKKGR